MKEEQETPLTPLDTIAGRNGLQIMKAFLPYINLSAQMSFAFLIILMALQNLRSFFQNSRTLTAQSFSSNSGSPMDMLSEIVPYFPVAMREQINQGIQMMEMLKTVQEMNPGFENFDMIQSMFTQSDSGKENM